MPRTFGTPLSLCLRNRNHRVLVCRCTAFLSVIPVGNLPRVQAPKSRDRRDPLNARTSRPRSLRRVPSPSTPIIRLEVTNPVPSRALRIFKLFFAAALLFSLGMQAQSPSNPDAEAGQGRILLVLPFDNLTNPGRASNASAGYQSRPRQSRANQPRRRKSRLDPRSRPRHPQQPLHLRRLFPAHARRPPLRPRPSRPAGDLSAQPRHRAQNRRNPRRQLHPHRQL